MLFWATVTGNSSPYVTGLLSCLSCLFVTLVYCGQTVEWIKMPLRTEVGLGPGNIVLDGDPATHGKKLNSSPTFRPILLWQGLQSQQLRSSCYNLFAPSFPVPCIFIRHGAVLYSTSISQHEQ